MQVQCVKAQLNVNIRAKTNIPNIRMFVRCVIVWLSNTMNKYSLEQFKAWKAHVALWSQWGWSQSCPRVVNSGRARPPSRLDCLVLSYLPVCVACLWGVHYIDTLYTHAHYSDACVNYNSLWCVSLCQNLLKCTCILRKHDSDYMHL